MKYRATLLVFIFLILSAFAHAQSASTATIMLRADSSAGERVYLKRFHAPGLEYDIVDSANVESGRVQFHIVPDPMREYTLFVGASYAADDIYLAPGDSLVFSYTPWRRRLMFDKIGANKLFRDSSNRPRSQADFYARMGQRDWDGVVAYVAAEETRMQQSDAIITSHFPEHTGMAAAMRSAEIRWYCEPRFRYFSKYFNSDTKIDSIDVVRARFMDSIPWADPLFAHGDEIDYISNEWLNLSTFLLHRLGIDSIGTNYQLKDFNLALLLPAPARDAAVLSTLYGLDYMPADSVVPLAEYELKQYKPAATDPEYIQKFQEKIAMYQAKMSGKPAPEFLLPDTTGRMISLRNFRGKTIYLDFWGTWCHPCLMELPALRLLEKAFHRDTSVVFVSIGLENSHYKDQNLAAWRKFITDSTLDGPQLYADDQFQNEYVQRYGIEGVPAYMIIGPDGNFIDSAAPRPSSGRAEDAIRAALQRNKE